MSMGNILAIDAGNTRVKWCLFDAGGNMLENCACPNTELAMAKFPNAVHVIISNVAGNAIAELLRSLLSNSATIHWVQAQSAACHVINRYDKPATLGSDRWAALIAAWHIKHAPCVVVNAGTAVTIDALSILPENNENPAEFIGGLILPGLNLMQQSLGLATAQLPKVEPAPNFSRLTPITIFAQNTTDAIHAGTLHAILGAVELMAHALTQQCKQTPYVIISGGNAEIIKDNLRNDMVKQALIVDNLVLLGLYLLETSMQGNQQ